MLKNYVLTSTTGLNSPLGEKMALTNTAFFVTSSLAWNRLLNEYEVILHDLFEDPITEVLINLLSSQKMLIHPINRFLYLF